MTSKSAALLAGGISIALLGGALFFQYGLGMTPCHLCYIQRWAHVLAILCVGLYLMFPGWVTSLVGLLGALAASGAGFFHAGVELSFWAGPVSCSGEAEDLSSMTGAELLSMDGPVKIVKCTEVVWDLLGISMAGWNGLISLSAVALWVYLLLGWIRKS